MYLKLSPDNARLVGSVIFVQRRIVNVVSFCWIGSLLSTLVIRGTISAQDSDDTHSHSVECYFHLVFSVMQRLAMH